MAIDTKDIESKTTPPTEKAGVASVAKTASPRKAPELDVLKKSLESRGIITPQGINIDALKKATPEDIKHVQSRLSDAGLYSPAMQDGKVGGLTEKAVKFAAEQIAAREYLSKVALQDKDRSKTDIMQMQAALNRLGYEAGRVDGVSGKNTEKALKEFLQENPQAPKPADPSLQKGALMQTFSLSAKVEPQEIVPAKPKTNLPTTDAKGHVLLDPDLIDRLEKSEETRKYVRMTFAAAEKYGLDPNMLANQFWAESKYKVSAVSHKGASSIVQMMPGTAKDRGLNIQDLKDPEKAIEAGAHMMSDLTKKHGTQKLALAAYNGGDRSIAYVERSTEKEKITHDDFVNKMYADIKKQGPGSRDDWREQTREYLEKILPEYWDDQKIKLALSKTENKQIRHNPNEPAIAGLESGNNINTAINLGTQFGPAASLAGLGISPDITEAQKLAVANYDTATLAEKFNTAQLGMIPQAPDMDDTFDPANPKINRGASLNPVGLG